MLDSMLRTYADVQPGPGLETRVLANLRAWENPRPWSRWNGRWSWILGGVFATAALLFVAWYWQAALLPAPPVTGFNTPAPPPTVPSPSVRAVRRNDNIRPARSGEPAVLTDVRQEVFPSRTPLSEQEQALLRYLTGTPKKELIAQSRPDPPPAPPDDDETPQPRSQQVRKSESYNTR